MKKASYIFLLLLVLCLFPVFSFAEEQTTVELKVNEVKVNCNSQGRFIVDNIVYENSKSFFRTNGESLIIQTIPNTNCKIESIKYDTKDSQIVIDKEYIKISNINDNITINIKYKEKISVLDDKDIEKEVENTNNTMIKEEIINSGNKINLEVAHIEDFSYGNGKISVIIPKVNGFRFVEILNKSELIESIITKEEMDAVVNGENWSILIEARIIDENYISIKYRRKIEDYIRNFSNGKNKIGNYVEIKIHKIDDENNKKVITNIDKPIKILFNLPKEMCFENVKYHVLSVENENVISQNDLDEDSKTITIETNNFSTYTITYTESNFKWRYLSIIVGLILIIIYIIFKKRKSREETQN